MQELRGAESIFGPCKTTERQIARDNVREEVVSALLERMGASGYEQRGQACYVYGMGSHPKATYAAMDEWLGVEVVFSESVAPWPLRWIPSHRGLVEIINPSNLGRVFERLMENSMVGIFCFESTQEARFVEVIRTDRRLQEISAVVKSDPSYLAYVVCADAPESSTGIIDFASFELEGPWVDFFALDSI